MYSWAVRVVCFTDACTTGTDSAPIIYPSQLSGRTADGENRAVPHETNIVCVFLLSLRLLIAWPVTVSRPPCLTDMPMTARIGHGRKWFSITLCRFQVRSESTEFPPRFLLHLRTPLTTTPCTKRLHDQCIVIIFVAVRITSFINCAMSEVGAELKYVGWQATISPNTRWLYVRGAAHK